MKAVDRRTRAFKHMKLYSPLIPAPAPAPASTLSPLLPLPPPPLPQQSLPTTIEETPLEVLANYATYSYDLYYSSYYKYYCKHFVHITQPCHMCK